MKSELLHFTASDGVTLPGVLYEPRRRSDDVLVFLHGNGDSSVFYSHRTLILGDELARRGVAFFAFNNRGAHLVKRLTKRGARKSKSIDAGMAHELIRDAVYDIEGAVGEMRRRGYRRVHLVGHSTGANKIAVYNARRPRNRVSSYVLLSGGDDSGLYRAQWGDHRFETRLAISRAKIDANRGSDFVPSSWSPFLITYSSMYDTIKPDGDYNVFPFLEVLSGRRYSRKPLFRLFRKIRKRSLVLYGARDEYCFDDVPACVQILRSYAPPRAAMTFEIMADANHSYRGAEERLAARLARWAIRGEGRVFAKTTGRT